MENLVTMMNDLRNRIQECQTLCREMGTDWEVVLRRKEPVAKVVIKWVVTEKIATIQSIRKVLGWSLLESKQAVDKAALCGEYDLFRSTSTTEARDLCDRLRLEDPRVRDNFEVCLTDKSLSF